MQQEKYHQQITSTILMVLPTDFDYNEQTAVDNEFMSKYSEEQISYQICQKAIQEFEEAVKKLRQNDINVLVFDKRNILELKNTIMPDAVFPNNWISTEPTGQSLEGTGAIIIDRIYRRAYAARSQRADEELFKNWCQTFNYEAVMFDAKSFQGNPIYHTNIIMSLGEKYAVVCKECINYGQVEEVLRKMGEGRELIFISINQMEQGLCGNILQVKSYINENRYLVMSKLANENFTIEQRKILEKNGKIVAIDIPTIEKIGGGSARCMLAEIFLDQKI
ncbi:hypothetical protein IMG5_116880 [Ichthyophthirius multifiliis]|uniref:Amidinotransferase n=1 Tax=Ichthyophthirius multifiliis TaxID=5932 RepID=G0QUG2_ICHMU|nr:hypothetical protein IMG5_116880 [Ichthyophthirius multifiliis]EGR31158.1 hypothetical protein IMG5_116880 [Ichthyophthirius multifiliis]|eukprot:XP_004034644.1 hypothetical protein IMG5_116880 [Ichthyophthirius multifiliis]